MTFRQKVKTIWYTFVLVSFINLYQCEIFIIDTPKTFVKVKMTYHLVMLHLRQVTLLITKWRASGPLTEACVILQAQVLHSLPVDD